MKHIKVMEEKFIQTIAHDMKAKLTSMLAYTQLLRRHLPIENHDEHRFLDNIETHIKSFTVSTEDVTDLLKYLSSNYLLEKNTFFLIEVIEAATKQLKQKFPQILMSNTSSTSVQLYADQGRIQKAIENILFHGLYTNSKIDLQTKKNKNSIEIIIDKSIHDNLQEQLPVLEEVKFLVAREIIAAHKGKVTLMIEINMFRYIISLPLRD